MEFNITDIEIGDMDAQLELIGTLAQRTRHSRGQESKSTRGRRKTNERNALKKFCSKLSPKTIAKQYPKPKNMTKDAWKSQIRRKAKEEGWKSLNPREARILYQLKTRNKKTSRKRTLRLKNAKKTLEQSEARKEAAFEVYEEICS